MEILDLKFSPFFINFVIAIIALCVLVVIFLVIRNKMIEDALDFMYDPEVVKIHFLGFTQEEVDNFHKMEDESHRKLALLKEQTVGGKRVHVFPNTILKQEQGNRNWNALKKKTPSYFTGISQQKKREKRNKK